jgi:hypothetical protein
MAVWKDITLKVDDEAAALVDVDPTSGDVHMTWHEDRASVTLIVSQKEARALLDKVGKVLEALVTVVLFGLAIQ